MIWDDFFTAFGPDANFEPESVSITGISTLESATETELAMVSSAKWLAAAKASKAGVLLVHGDLKEGAAEKLGSRPMLFVSRPWDGIRWLLERMFPNRTHCWPGIHPSAVIHETAQLGEGVQCGPYVVVGPGASVGKNTRLAAGTIIGQDCVIGEDCSFHPNVVLEAGTIVGHRVEIHAGVVLGADGFKYEVLDGVRVKIPQVGIVVIENDVELGANTCIDRASYTETRVGHRTKIDNLVQVGHNVLIGEDCVIVAQVGIGGSTNVGRRSILAGQVGVADNLRLGEGTVALGRSALMNDIEPGSVVMGEPARPHRQNLRFISAKDKLPEALNEVKRLARELEAALLRISELESCVKRSTTHGD